MRFTFAVDRPARHERAVTDLRLGNLTLNRNAPSADEQSIERESAAACSLDTQRVGPVGMPVEQANHRPLTVGRSQLQTLTLPQMDVDLLDVDAAVGDLDYRVGVLPCVVFAPLLKCSVDGAELLFRTNEVQLVRFWLRQWAVVLASTDVCAEAVVIRDPNAILWSIPGWKDYASQHWVDRHPIVARSIAPPAEVGRNDSAGGDHLALGCFTTASLALSHPDDNALPLAVVDFRRMSLDDMVHSLV